MFKKNYTTEMNGSRKTVEKHFTAITSNKKRGIITGISVFTAIIISGAAGFINSIASDSTKIYSNTNDIGIVTATIHPQETLAMVNPYMSPKHPYNDSFVDITGKTITDSEEKENITLDELRAQYQLSADMPSDINETVTYNMIPCKKMAEIYSVPFEELKQTMHFTEFVTDDTPLGQALDEVTLSDYAGTNYIDEFREYYRLEDDITAEITWKEGRLAVEDKQQEDEEAMRESVKITNALNNADSNSSYLEEVNKNKKII